MSLIYNEYGFIIKECEWLGLLYGFSNDCFHPIHRGSSQSDSFNLAIGEFRDVWRTFHTSPKLSNSVLYIKIRKYTHHESDSLCLQYTGSLNCPANRISSYGMVLSKMQCIQLTRNTKGKALLFLWYFSYGQRASFRVLFYLLFWAK